MASSDRTLRAFIGYDMKRALNVVLGDLGIVLAGFGLRMTTYSTLVVIRDNPGLRQTRLAEILMIERPNLVLILDDLEEAELVTRIRAPDDRRAYELTATPKGKRLCEQATAAVNGHDTRMTRGLSDEEVAALHRALRQIELNGRTSDDPSEIPRP
ncbi:MarR family winged helix-turn-helix transcriptional regulator [Pararhodobacter zhoushanensis]|uniref:MarR family transcriptional regulator n=1 Tax=Pararhodobacter zhoushanensis TaxID=2479545 RepID=A0ABT3GTV0_9RHOB|nr:MarR family transcriptional regulator [Pararhodobacter zhoushanensis]MCW1930953.1 MarR family transcriptional regulator [Pararhodobacter zhoushanensis]